MVEVAIKKLMIIEDEAMQIKVLTDRFLQEGFQVTTALDGEAGYQRIMSEHPDIILLDNKLPGTSGMEILKQLRSGDEWAQTVPVIFFSNVELNAEEHAMFDGQKLSTYLLKSDTNLADLVEKVKAAVGIVKKK